MQKRYLLVLILPLLLLGCIQPPTPPDDSQSATKVDVSISSFTFQNQTPISLSSQIPLKVSISSDNSSAKYRLYIKINGEQVFQKAYWGSQELDLIVPAQQDGQVNITASVLLSEGKLFFDRNVSNDRSLVQVNISPLVPQKYLINNSDVTDVNVYGDRSYATQLVLDQNTSIYSLGVWIRRGAITSPNSKLFFNIRPEINNTISNQTVAEFSTSFVQVSPEWGFVMLATEPKTIPNGKYWIEFSVEEGANAEIACYQESTNTSATGLTLNSKIRWEQSNCTPYFIISSRSPKTVVDGKFILFEEFIQR
jgi:hypothetical protein